MKIHRFYFICFFILLLAMNVVSAQSRNKQIEIKHADKLIGERKNGVDIRKLIGNVQLQQGDIKMYCDSAYLFESNNSVTAYSNVHINQGDSLNMYGNRLDYDGNRKYAVVYENVRLTDRQMTLTTNRLDYDVQQKTAFYLDGGTIVDSENRLTSKKGYYFTQNKNLFFRENVYLSNPQYEMNSDTLQYNIVNRIAYFHGPTTIRSQSDLIYCETGWYNTLKNTAAFGKNAYLKSGSQFLYGDSLYYDRKNAFGKAVNNIRVLDTSEKLLITGGYAEHYEKVKQTFITKNVLVTKGYEKDSIYLTADTLRSAYDSSKTFRILKAYHHSRIYNKEFQGRADSIIYSFVDSTIDFRQRPVFWFGEYQSTAERILLFTKRNTIEHVELIKDAFLASREDTLRYNQIKGRDMRGEFSDNKLNTIYVNGNGESIYYIRDDEKAYIGMNKIVAADIKIRMNDNKVSRINFIKKPDATLFPIKEVKEEDTKLAGFVWYGKERPQNKADMLRMAAEDDAALQKEIQSRETQKPVIKPKPKKSKR